MKLTDVTVLHDSDNVYAIFMGNPRARAIVEFLCPRNKDLVDENGPGGTTVMPVVFCEEHAREFCDQLRDAGLVVELETTPRNALRQ